METITSSATKPDTNNENNDVQQQQEEDVPENFFDDFMNEDFIDGLNVVDTWDEDESKKTKSKENRKKSPRRSRSPRRKRLRSKSPRYHRSVDRKEKDKEKEKDKDKGKEKEKDKYQEKEKDKERDRRDPTKTQRDILRDKDKCAKDQKAKMISEKLRVVETGLVPPGMEMEFDIVKLSSTSVTNKLQKIRRSVEKNRSSENLNERKYRRSTPDRIRRSPIQKTSIERSPIRKSPIPRIKRSPLRRSLRSRSRTRSPRRLSETSGGSRRRIEDRRIEDRRIEDRRIEDRRIEDRRIEDRRIEERRIEERIRDRRRKSLSRSPRRRRSKTPQSDISERERWLRRRSRSRSRSPRRNKTFLQELGDKLKPEDKKILIKEGFILTNNKILKPDVNNLNTNMLTPHPGFLPAPVPPPQNFIPQTLIVPPQSNYDQQFFIGQSDMGPPSFPPIPRPLSFIPPDHMIPLQPTHIPYNMMMEPQPVPMPNEFIPINTPLQPQKPPSSPLLGKDALSKLFNDKKIMLSDYLSLTGKFTDESRPQNIQNKIKVIADCQDVIKELTGDPQNKSRFAVRKVNKPPDHKTDQKHQSPLKKIPVVRFQFTNRTKSSEESPSMGSQLTKLLHKFGKEFHFEDINPKASPIESKSNNSSTQSPPPPPTIFEADKVMFSTSTSSSLPTLSTYSTVKVPPAKVSFQIASKNPQPSVVKPSTHTMFTQTDRYKCTECEVRNAKISINVITQTSDTLMTFDVACQVGPEDFPKQPTKSILKNNQSLASMTPAQLLANARDLQSSPPPSSSKYHTSTFESPDSSKRNHNRAFGSPDSFSDYNDFDRYRSETVKGGAIFERDRGPGSNVSRDVIFGSIPRNGPPIPSFGYQPRPPGFSSYGRPDNDGMGSLQPPPPGHMGYRGRDGRWY